MLLDNRPGRKKRYVAPERPAGASPVDYGGRHPFDFTVGRKRQRRRRQRRWLQQNGNDETGGNGNGDDNEDRVPDRRYSFNYEPIRINYDTTIVERLLQESITRNSVVISTQAYLLLYEVLPRTAAIWKSVLKVIPVQGPLIPLNNPVQPNPTFCPPESTLGIPVDDTDLWILVTTHRHFCDDAEGTGFNTQASALSCERDQYDRPVTGAMDFCLDNIGSVSPIENVQDAIVQAKNRTSVPPLLRTDANYEAISKMVNVAIHELGHVLGLTSDSLPFLRNPMSGRPYTPRPFRLSTALCSNGEEQVVLGPPGARVLSRSYQITTPIVQQVVRNHFRCQRLAGAPLENQPTSEDCFGSHWEERWFYTELMGAFISPTVNTLTPLTLAFLEDTSWYRANYESPHVSNGAFGHSLGCDFVEKPCIADGFVPEYGRDNFCNEQMELSANGIVTQEALPQKCDPSHRFKAHCDFRPVRTVDTDIPDYVYSRYFPNGRNVAIPHEFVAADYCPIPSQKLTNCQDPNDAFSASMEYSRAREVFGPDSMCFEVPTRERSICLESTCNAQLGKLQMKVLYGLLVTCQYDGQVHTLLGDTPQDPFQVKCPRLAQACPDLVCPDNCSGRGVCQVLSNNENDGDSNNSPNEANTIDHSAKCVCFDKRDTTVGCYQTSMAAVYRQAGFLTDHNTVETKPDTQVFLIVMGLLFGTLIGLQIAVHLKQLWRRRKYRRGDENARPVPTIAETEHVRDQDVAFHDEPGHEFPDLLSQNAGGGGSVQIHMNGAAVRMDSGRRDQEDGVDFPDLLAPNQVENTDQRHESTGTGRGPPRYLNW